MKAVATFGAVTAALIAVLFWAGNFVVARGLQEDGNISAFSIALGRWLIAFVALTPFIPMNGRLLRRLFKDHSWRLLAIAGFGVFGFASFTYLAARGTTSASLSIIALLSPVIIAVYHIIHGHQSYGHRGWVSLALGIIGASFLVINQLSQAYSNPIWMVFMFLAAFCWSMYNLLVEQLNFYPSIILVWVTAGLGSALLLPAALIETWVFGYELPLDQGGLIALIYLGLGVSVLGYVLWTRAIFTLGSGLTSIIYLTIPAITAILAFIFFREPLTALQLIGMMTLIAAVALLKNN